MKKLMIFATAATMAIGLSACTPGQNVPGSTAAGAIAGGLAGGLLFHGSGQWAGIVGGALLGGIVGNQIGQSMDRRDRANMQSAIVKTPVGQEATWTNSKTDTTYVVRPVKQYKYHSMYCREFQTRIKIGNKWRNGYGRACRQPDGSWKIVK